MPWNDCVFENWDDCYWQNWDDCEWDKFSSRDRKRQRRTPRRLGPEAMGDYSRRPFQEGNPSYVEDMKRYSDKAFADATMRATGEEVRHLEFKKPYKYDTLQKMKYKDKPDFVHQGMQDVATPMGILGERKEPELEWRWVRYFDDSRWTPTTGKWFDNRWIGAGAGEGAEVISSTSDGYINLGGSSFSSWAWVHDGGTGSGDVFDSEGYDFALRATYPECRNGYCYNIYRCFFYFDLSAYSGTVSSCSLVLRGKTNEGASVSVQEGTQASSPSTADYDSFTGNEFGHIVWDASGDNTMTFDATGITYIQSIIDSSGVALLCCREYDHDYLDTPPSEGDSFISGCYFADSATAAYRPKLIVGGVESGIDLSVLSDTWYKKLRPKKFRMKFNEATADVSLEDSNATEIYANATYASLDEVDLDFAGAEDISKLVVSGSRDITDIEFLVRVEKAASVASDQRVPRTEPTPRDRQAPFLEPSPKQESKRKPRRKGYRATKLKRERYVKDQNGRWIKVLY